MQGDLNGDHDHPGQPRSPLRLPWSSKLTFSPPLAPRSIPWSSRCSHSCLNSGSAFIATVISIVGLINTLVMLLNLLQKSLQRSERVRNSPLVLLYGMEAWYAVRLLQVPSDGSALNLLAIALILLTVFGVARAWALADTRRFFVRDLISPRGSTRSKESENPADPGRADQER